MGQAIFDNRMPALATKLVNRFAGATGVSTITVTVQGAYNPLDGTQGADTDTVTVTDVSPPVPVTDRMITDNAAVLAGDEIIYIDGPQITLTRAMINNLVLTYDGRKSSMVWLKTFYSGANIAFYEVYLRDV
jgi:hypothetical protein